MSIDKGQYILVTGCGRTATTFTAALLSAIGLDVKHEKAGKNGMADWHSAVIRQDEKTIILHQLRDPIKVMGSLTTFNPYSWDYINKFIPMPDNLLQKCMLYWLYWNRLTTVIQSKPLLYQVELIHLEWDKICHHINIPETTELPEIPKDMNHRNHPQLEWWQLEEQDQKLVDEIRKQAGLYGYEMCYDN